MCEKESNVESPLTSLFSGRRVAERLKGYVSFVFGRTSMGRAPVYGRRFEYETS